jgi:hypothetical protein
MPPHPNGSCCQPCERRAPECRQCGSPQVQLALPPDNWPAQCVGCDECDPLRSCCPSKDEFYIFPPRPRWYVTLEGAAIRREPTHNLDFASLGLLPAGTVVPTGVVLSTSDFNYDFTASGRLVVGHTFNECLQIEGIFFGVAQGDNTAAVRDNTQNSLGSTGNLFSPFGGFGSSPILGLDYNNFAQIHYTSSLQSAELNLVRKLPSPPSKLTTSILFGVRYIGLPEEFDYETISNITSTGQIVTNGATNTMHVATTNELVGPQVGGLFEFYVDNRWWVNVEMKAGVMNNHGHQSTTYTNVNAGTTTVYSESRTEDHTAFAEEISVQGVYRWTPHFSTQIGYRALWIQNLALAPENLNTDIQIITQGPPQLNHGESTVYHGPFAGVTISW